MDGRLSNSPQSLGTSAYMTDTDTTPTFFSVSRDDRRMSDAHSQTQLRGSVQNLTVLSRFSSSGKQSRPQHTGQDNPSVHNQLQQLSARMHELQRLSQTIVRRIDVLERSQKSVISMCFGCCF